MLDELKNEKSISDNKKTKINKIETIEKLFKQVDKKLKVPEFGGIVEEAIECSIFGVFGRNYKNFSN
jgi:hypothetical protein